EERRRAEDRPRQGVHKERRNACRRARPKSARKARDRDGIHSTINDRYPGVCRERRTRADRAQCGFAPCVRSADGLSQRAAWLRDRSRRPSGLWWRRRAVEYAVANGGGRKFERQGRAGRLSLKPQRFQRRFSRSTWQFALSFKKKRGSDVPNVRRGSHVRRRSLEGICRAARFSNSGGNPRIG